jgi:hypothetical protein
MNKPSTVANDVDRGQMRRENPISTLFLDIGGVLLADG